ncbi:MAG: gliding motility lipoprotein GldH [Bacteroidota bacterium]
MRSVFCLAILTLIIAGCDADRVYEKNNDFKAGYWILTDKPEFEFEIDDTQAKYNVYCNIRNSVTYPYSRLFLNYNLYDSSGNELHKNLVSHVLFDPKSGKPQGSSGLGDIYDQQFLLLRNYEFKNPGKYKVKFEQFMRTDTLQGILAVGTRIEKATDKAD